MNRDKTRNVLIIESGEGVGGSAFSMYRIIKYLDKSRYRPHAFVYYKTAVFSEIADLGVPVVKLPVYSVFPRELPENGSLLRRVRNYVVVYGNLIIETLFNGFRLARYIRRTDIDLVHCNNGFFENFAAAFAARITNRPCVSHVRGTEPLMKIEKSLGSWVSKFIVLNPDMYDLYSEAFGPTSVRLVYNGVDLDEFERPDAQKIRDEFSLSSNDFCIGTFARLVEGKGIPEFLQMAARLGQSHDYLKFFIAGGGAEDGSDFVNDLHTLADELGISDKVIFAGWRDDVRDCMAAMDLVLQISTTFPEGMSLAPIEAMTLSKPVIVTDNPGYANVIADGHTGYVVPSGDVDALVVRVRQLIDDRDLARNLGRNGRARVLDQFDYRIVAGHIQDIYVEALAG
jgi:glycosyltransferase involved in cell wall biosynthesis